MGRAGCPLQVGCLCGYVNVYRFCFKKRAHTHTPYYAHFNMVLPSSNSPALGRSLATFLLSLISKVVSSEGSVQQKDEGGTALLISAQGPLNELPPAPP